MPRETFLRSELPVGKLNLKGLRDEIALALKIAPEQVAVVGCSGGTETVAYEGKQPVSREVPASITLDLPDGSDIATAERVLRAHAPARSDDEELTARAADDENRRLEKSQVVQRLADEIKALKAQVAELMRGRK